MPQSMITNVTTGGSTRIQAGPGSKPACPASPGFAPALAAWARAARVPPGTLGGPAGSGIAHGANRLPQRSHRGQHRRGLIPAVRHAVRAPRVLAPPVLV